MNEVTYQLPMFARLQPCRPWNGGRIADTDILSLDEAAKQASLHAKAEVTPADFLRAAARGEIPLRAICRHGATMTSCFAGGEPLTLKAGSVPTLPLDACKALAVSGIARWRTFDGFAPVPTFGGMLGRYTSYQLPDGEPDLETALSDCRVIGADVHALADAFLNVPDRAANKAGDAENIGTGKTGDDAPSSYQKKTGRSRTAKEIMAAFPDATWGDKLTRCTSGKYQWLKGTWTRKGSPRPGDATTFNPVLLCAAAVAQGFLTLHECDTAFEMHFMDWAGEWADKSALLR